MVFILNLIKNNGNTMSLSPELEAETEDFLRDAEDPLLLSLESDQECEEIPVHFSESPMDMVPQLKTLARLGNEGVTIQALKSFLQIFDLSQMDQFDFLYVGSYRTKSELRSALQRYGMDNGQCYAKEGLNGRMYVFRREEAPMERKKASSGRREPPRLSLL